MPKRRKKSHKQQHQGEQQQEENHSYDDTNDDDSYNSVEANFLSTSAPISTKQKQPVEKKKNGRTTTNNTTKASASASASRSRKRKAPSSTKQKQQQQPSNKNKPPVVPEPPSSLVSLLRKNKKVLGYFTALQQNLAYDVQKWKDKAMGYRSDLIELRKSTGMMMVSTKKDNEEDGNISRASEDEDEKEDEKEEDYNESRRKKKINIGDTTSRSRMLRKPHPTTKEKNTNGRENNPSPPLETIHLDNGNSINDENSELDMEGEGEKNSKTTTQTYSNRQKRNDNDEEDSIDSSHSDNPTNSKDANVNHKEDKIDKKEEEGVPITDEIADALFADSSSSSSSSSSSLSNNVTLNDQDKEEEYHDSLVMKDNMEATKVEILTKLIKAFQNFEQLGVTLLNIYETVDYSKIVAKGNDEGGNNMTTDGKDSIIDESKTNDISSQSNVDDAKSESSSSSDDDDSGAIFGRMFEEGNEAVETPAAIENKATERQEEEEEEEKDDGILMERRSDIEVITDLMHAIRATIRIPTTDLKNEIRNSDKIPPIYPFCGEGLIPCCYTSSHAAVLSCGEDDDDSNVKNEIMENLEHPAAKGFQILIESLIIMDTYCSNSSPFSSEKEWESLFRNPQLHVTDEDNDNDGGTLQNQTLLEKVKVGMYNRNLTSMLLTSLDGEISNYWGVADRATRGTTSVLVYNQDEDSSSSSDSDESSDLHLTTDRDTTNEVIFSSKCLNRLFQLAERILYARLVSCLYQGRGEIQEVSRLLMEYVLSTSPCPSIEEYPKFPPTMSMCILEALLGETDNRKEVNHDFSGTMTSGRKSWFNSFLNSSVESCTSGDRDGKQPLLSTALATNIHVSASIWKDRLDSKDKRIRDVSKVEIAAYQRLLVTECDWLQLVDQDSNDLIQERCQQVLNKATDILSWSSGSDLDPTFDGKNVLNLCLPIRLSLLTTGDIGLAKKRCKDVIIKLDTLLKGENDTLIQVLNALFMACFHACISLQSFHWELKCLRMQSIRDGSDSAMIDESEVGYDIGNLLDDIIHMVRKHANDKNITLHNTFYQAVTTALRCSLVLSDGIRANQIAKVAMIEQVNDRYSTETMIDVGESPTVRVINLEGRKDRWRNFITQTQREQLLVVHALASLEEPEEWPLEEDISFFWGGYAYDGRDLNQLDFEQKIQTFLGEKQVLKDLIATYWCPKDLKVFDRHARDDVDRVLMSPTERACALSHISSWVGIKRTLTSTKSEIDEKQMIDRQLVQLFKISGYARGAPLLLENKSMSPTPVCVILEDDAMLVDRFSDRLNLLLEELPRDFHFCSLGYGRPKNAPILKYSSQIGFPTCIWYLTGYILSLEGAKYLLDSLPVVGPVDSWIGQKMTANFDNSYGHRMGIGSATKAHIENEALPKKSILGEMMKFRSFAALTPLCSQKLGWSSSSATADRSSWRDRDTDVTFTGHGR